MRFHAVIVRPDEWPGAPIELARLLSPIAGANVAALVAALGRGPMTVEADLSVADARRLAQRLVDLGVPARIEPPPEDAPPVFNIPHDRITEEVPRTRSTTMVGHKRTPVEDDGGWGALFPDLAVQDAVPTYPPSLDDLEGSAAKPVATRQRTVTPVMLFEEDDFDLPDESDLDFDFSISDVEVVLPTPPPPAQTASTGSRKLDRAKLDAVLPEREDAPAYRPTGYDPRPEHHPPFAAGFALLAPGAGHVFNGDDDGAMRTLLRSWMIVPWVKSVKACRDEAEKIRTYHAPRPEDGNGLRAFRWSAIFWACVALAVVVAMTLLPMLVDLIEKRAPAEDPSLRVAAVVQSASTTTLAARITALDAVADATRDVARDHQFTLTEEERAERLFVIAFAECKRKSYAVCAAMMRRVLELRPGYSAAIRLQAWASVSMSGARDPMPDVGNVPTLSKLELSTLRQEMALEGEDVPAPPDDDVEDADAGEEVIE